MKDDKDLKKDDKDLKKDDKDLKKDDKDLKKDWLDENQSYGAFVLTQEEIDFYFNKFLF